ncbi:uncharacterized protein C20orf96-like isoform X2 [Lineus longissimus]|uniref:uncharacterized protein C20orf96-like isoform X2 n=1 Tax=Lineus longissimus TaxID=88925 RepID=UPI002B4E1845
MSAGGWGRRAAARIDKTQTADEELLKSLGEQIDIDYTQWQRTSQPEVIVQPRPPRLKLTRPKADFSSSAVKLDGDATQSFSHICRHIYTRNKFEAPDKDVGKADRMRMLRMKIQAKRNALADFKKREIELVRLNRSIKNDIETDESLVHDKVKHLLRKYEKFRGGVSTLNVKFNQDLDEVIADFKATSERVTGELEGLQASVQSLDDQLKVQQEQLKILLNYKDKEYPVKAIQINELQKKIQQLKVENEDEEDELEHIIGTELGKIHKERKKVREDITSKVTEVSIGKMHQSLKDMALQNMVMEKEIEFHTNQIKELKAINRHLEKTVEAARNDPKTNVRVQLFPELFPNRPKCTPDMELVLDIPMQEWLPI